MTDSTQQPPPEPPVDITSPQSTPTEPDSSGLRRGPATSSRLQLLRYLIYAGRYNVPATLVAERMIDYMIAHKRTSK